jgi:peptide deformylase
LKTLEIEKGRENEILRAKSRDLKPNEFGKDLKIYAKQMLKAMVKANGIGIAAPQVGRNIRVFLTTINCGSRRQRVILMANPKFLEMSEEMVESEEGCLSLPGETDVIMRHKEVTIEYLDVEGNRKVLELDGLDAIIVQHETDHLNGMLYVDRVEG